LAIVGREIEAGDGKGWWSLREQEQAFALRLS
jgi:hypothetical protein